MKEFTITKGLTALFAGFIMSTTAAQAEPRMEISAHYGNSGVVGFELGAGEKYGDKGALFTSVRATKLSNDSYLRTFNLLYGHNFSEKFAGIVGVGALLTDYSSSLQLDSLRPTVNIGGGINIGGYVPAITGHIYDAHNCGIKLTIPAYTHMFENDTKLTVGIYAEANRIEVEKQGEYGSTKDSETVRNIGLLAAVAF